MKLTSCARQRCQFNLKPKPDWKLTSATVLLSISSAIYSAGPHCRFFLEHRMDFRTLPCLQVLWRTNWPPLPSLLQPIKCQKAALILAYSVQQDRLLSHSIQMALIALRASSWVLIYKPSPWRPASPPHYRCTGFFILSGRRQLLLGASWVSRALQVPWSCPLVRFIRSGECRALGLIQTSVLGAPGVAISSNQQIMKLAMWWFSKTAALSSD